LLPRGAFSGTVKRMNVKLKQVLDKVAALPDAEQAEYAALLESWIESARAPGTWPQPELEALAEAAVAEYRAGKTLPLDFGRG